MNRVSVIDAAAELNKILNIFITENFQAATKRLAKNNNNFNFLFAVKDCFSTEGIQTTCGSAMLKGYVPPYNATVVEKLANAGGILLGKTNMDEFSMGSSSTQGHFGPVKNPWTVKIWKENGLSSSELLDRMKALGSDTGGSVRNPAAFCGVIGLKPSYGLISRHGVIPLVNSLDVPAILTSSVDDAALALGREFNFAGLSEEIWRTWNEVANWLVDEAGCSVQEVSMPHIQYSIQCYHVLGECEIASNMARYDGVEFGYRPTEPSVSVDSMYANSRHTAFNEVVRRRILAGNYFLLRKNYHQYFVQAMKVRRLIAQDFWNLFRKKETSRRIDILLTPITCTDAPLFSEFSGSDGGYERERQDDYFTQPINMAGVPAISVPIKLSGRGLPISLQLISDNFEEGKLLTIAKWIESRANFPYLSREQWLYAAEAYV